MKNSNNEDKLNGIHSFYMTNKIFSFLYINKRLKIIIYNKKYQKLFKIGIEEYKEVSGRYKIGGNSGTVKEYSLISELLVFEGEYLNGERNGKGKEYDSVYLKYDGEFKNGRKNGKGKEYNSYNYKLIYEGEYLNGERNGKGKGYYNENIIYSLKNGKGFIKEYDFIGNFIFEGEYLNGKRNGKGKEYYKF